MEDKIRNIIQDLINKTKSKKANWERVGTTDQYTLTLKTGKIIINKVKSSYVVLAVSIYNAKGDNIYHKSSIEGERDYIIFKELHDNVVATFFKVDETIEGILGEINSEDEIGEDTNLPF